MLENYNCFSLRSTMFQLYRGVINDGGGHWATDLSQVNVSSISFQIAFATLVLTTKVDVNKWSWLRRSVEHL
jgi:hypothetical protein